MNTKPTIAYLGPEGTYSDEAARMFAARMGCEAEFIPCPSFNTVFDFVDRGKCTYGVVPTENSIEGSVTSTLDNFAFTSTATILGELVLPIHHCLLLAPGVKLEDVETIASHPQGLAQCRRYINANLPSATFTTTRSTAESAQRVMEDPHIAGIASVFAAELFGAEVKERDIEDHFGNETSFALIGRQDAPQVFEGQSYKTSLALFINQDRAGTLLMILNEFAYAGINLSMIQSRPTKQGLGNYMFFVNFDGNVTEPHIQTALNCLRLKLREVKVLGCYPVQ